MEQTGQNKQKLKNVAIGALIVGTVFLGFGIDLLYNTIHLYLIGSRSTGNFVGYVGTYKSLSPEYSFADSRGGSHFVVGYGFDWQTVPVRVLYDPQNPNDAVIDSPSSWVFGAAVFGMGILGIGLGIGILRDKRFKLLATGS